MITTSNVCVFIKFLKKKDAVTHNGNTCFKMALRPNVHAWIAHKISPGKWWMVSCKP